jgi:hypothetical protein
MAAHQAVGDGRHALKVSKHVDLELASRQEIGSGAGAMRQVPRTPPPVGLCREVLRRR